MSIASPFAAVDIPGLSVFDYLFGDITSDSADRVALTGVDGRQLTYQALLRRIINCAGALAARGIGVGDVVALVLPNCTEFAICFHGILRAGATVTPVNVLAAPTDITKQLAKSGATHLVTMKALLPQVEAAAAEVGLPPGNIVVLDGEGSASAGRPNASDLFDSDLPAPEVTIDPATHIAVLPFSSGTTGNPKGVMLTHRNLVANICQLAPLHRLNQDHVVLAVLPFFHIYGLTVLLHAALRARANVVIMPRFDLSNFLRTIEKNRVTHAFIAPPIAVALAKHPDLKQCDTSSLRVLMSGAAPLDDRLSATVAERLEVRVVQSYGMTELSPASHMVPFDGGRALLGVEAPPSSCGWTVPGGEIKLVDPVDHNEITVPSEGLSAAGELWYRGPNVMAGYLDDAAATAAVIDADGYLHTGDIARVDPFGCVYIVDRIKELIKYKGYQVPPSELEAVLLTHPEIADAAVIGVIDPETSEEVPKAFVVAKDSALTGQAVIDYVSARVAPYKKVRIVAFLDAVPKSPTGKILRRTLQGGVQK